MIGETAALKTVLTLLTIDYGDDDKIPVASNDEKVEESSFVAPIKDEETGEKQNDFEVSI